MTPPPATPFLSQAQIAPAEAGQFIGAIFALSLFPLFVFMVPFAIGNFFLARRIDGASPVLWVILTLIPGVNAIFFYYVGYKVVFTVLDRLRALRA